MDKMMIIPHTHFDAEVFKTREEYLKWGFANIIEVLNMLNTHKEYKFTLDQVAYIKPFLEAYPELKENFMDMVKDKRLDIVAGLYVMPDVNMPSGESFVRQILLGKKYCKDVLGIDVKIGWMIDTFGHHPQIPQLMHKSGFEYYIFGRVTKESFSEFYWQGIDGTKLICHWMPLHYCVFWGAPSNIEQFKQFAEDRYNILKTYAVTNIIAALEGGDFNPPVHHTPDMVEKYNALENKPVELAVSTPSEFFEHLHKEKLPTVYDDFNPVFQGCYSARIEIKQQNRYLENLLNAAESWNAASNLIKAKNQQKLLEEAWEPVLFNQFHDVICGCHIDKVFDNAITRYRQAEMIAKNVLDSSIDFILSKTDTSGEGIPIVVYNQLSWDRKDVAKTSIAFTKADVFEADLVDDQGNSIPFQIENIVYYPNGAIKQSEILFIAQVPSLGYKTYRLIPNRKSNIKTSIYSNQTYGMTKLDIGILENEFYHIEVDLWSGVIKSIKLKETNEEFIDPATPLGNVIVKEEDVGDFWEINAPLRGGATRPINRLFPLPDKDKAWFSSSYGGSGGTTHGNIKAEFHYTQKSPIGTIYTIIRMFAGLKRIEIDTSLINLDKWVRYRAFFPTAIKNGAITYEIPFGAIARPEGEFPAQNWIDYSDAQKGLALLNQGLPGNGVIDGKIFISLLRCTSYVQYGNVGGFDPSAPADGGFEVGKQHQFRYALTPHKGNWQQAQLYKAGMEFNNPLIVKKDFPKKQSLPTQKSFLSVSASNVLASCIKQSNNTLIIRFYEAAGLKTENVKLEVFGKIKSAFETNLIEEEIKEAHIIDQNQICFNIGAFEIKTFKVELK